MFPFKRFSKNFVIFLALLLVVVGITLNGRALITLIKHKIWGHPNVVTIQPSSEVSSTKESREETPQPGSSLNESEVDNKVELGLVTSSADSRFGHLSYSVHDSDLMSVIGSYAQGENQRFERLLPEAALSLMKLIYAARDEGVWIVPVSAFRDFGRQEELFEWQIQKMGNEELAAKVSAPPGYSEHHTGYAVDLTDGRFPQQDITLQFAETEAFKWLQIHASEFGFELSFPENNSQGISYEPWHWRFVGSQAAQAVFSQAMNQ
jgi:D-alanyl-D-alanine carboxypeptidase